MATPTVDSVMPSTSLDEDIDIEDLAAPEFYTPVGTVRSRPVYSPETSIPPTPIETPKQTPLTSPANTIRNVV
jgi:hypothetical protein